MSTATRTMPQPFRLGPVAGALAIVTLIAAAGISASLGAFNGLGTKAAPGTAPHSLNVDRDPVDFGATTTVGAPHSQNLDRDGVEAPVRPYGPSLMREYTIEDGLPQGTFTVPGRGKVR